MKRLDIQKSSNSPNFIGSWSIEPLSVCDDLIDYFEEHKVDQNSGQTSAGLDLNMKNSTDIAISPNQINSPGNEVFNKYFQSLFECHKDYLSQWPFLSEIAANIERLRDPVKPKTGTIEILHTERSNLGGLHRLLAWMTYLNDVDNNPFLLL